MMFVIAGYGQFGKLAASRLRALYPQCSLVLIDRDSDKFTACNVPVNALTVIGGADTVVEDLIRSTTVDQWIIPTVPFHLSARVALSRFPELQESVLPEDLASLIPNPRRVDPATLWCSYADFLCPDDCEEGVQCSVTGETREPLHTALQNLTVSQKALRILVSRQLCPGIGGYASSDLAIFLEGLLGFDGVIGTSCKCHAVLTSLKWRSRILTK